MEKACEIAQSKLWFVKLTHTKFAKNAQNCAKFAKMPKIAQKKAKIFNKTREKKQN